MGSISVGIAAFNEEKHIARSVNCALDSRGVMEVIVVASGCTDNTVGVVKELMRKEKRLKLIIEKERRGKGSAINLILKNAKGEFIVMTDADLSFPPASIPELIKKFRHDTGAVSGRPEYFARSRLFSWWGRYAAECASRQREVREKKGFHGISGYLYAIRRGIVSKIPSGAKSEDAFVGKIVKEKGYGIAYAPRAIVNVGYAENFWDYLTQKIRTHYGHLEVFQEAGAESMVETAKMAGDLRGEWREYFRVANKMVRTPAEYVYFLAYLLTELTVWSIAFLKFYLKGEERWKQIKSTKKLYE